MTSAPQSVWTVHTGCGPQDTTYPVFSLDSRTQALARPVHIPRTVGTHQHLDPKPSQGEPLRVPVLLDLGSSWLRVDCTEISSDGLVVECGPVPVATVVELYMELPTRVAIEAQARVTRSEGNLVSLRFVALDAEARHAVDSYCRTSGLHRRISGTFQLAIPDTVVLS
jgi:hypothetical protein